MQLNMKTISIFSIIAKDIQIFLSLSFYKHKCFENIKAWEDYKSSDTNASQQDSMCLIYKIAQIAVLRIFKILFTFLKKEAPHKIKP